MAVKASASVTLSRMVEVDSITPYYLIQSSTSARPAKPTTNPPPSPWSRTEPTYAGDMTETLYVTFLNVLTDGTFQYTDVSVSTAYEAAKDAYSRAQEARKVAENYIHADSTNGLIVNNDQTVGVGYDIQLKANGSDTGMNVRQDGEALASFKADSVELGKNSVGSKVAMCGGKGGISAAFGYYIDSITSNNAEPGTTLNFDFNETTFKNKVGQKAGFYEFIYTAADGWEIFDWDDDDEPTKKVTLSQYGITMRTVALNDYAGITINYVLDGSVKIYNADISNPVRRLELEMAENPSSSESDYANITIERQSGTYESGDGKEHSIISMMTLHEFANVATLQLFDDEISIDASHLYLSSSFGEGAIELNGDTIISGNFTHDAVGLASFANGIKVGGHPSGLTIASASKNITIASGSTGNGTFTASKAGYYPIGIVGHSITNGSGSGCSYCRVYHLRLSARSSGSATVAWYAKAEGGKVNACGLNAYILWALWPW